jgi:ubiquitin carboxyl-terminal hydrolase 34
VYYRVANYLLQVYHFLTSLSFNGKIVKCLRDGQLSYRELFPCRQPYTALYVITIFAGQVERCRLISTEDGTTKLPEGDYALLKRIWSLIIAVLNDCPLIDGCKNLDLKIGLSRGLLDCFFSLLTSFLGDPQDASELTSTFLTRLLDLLKMTMTAPASDEAALLICRIVQIVLECSSQNHEVWQAFLDSGQVGTIVRALLVDDARESVRTTCAHLILDKTISSRESAAVSTADFREVFWPLMLQMIPLATREPIKCHSIFNLVNRMFDHCVKADVQNLATFDLLKDLGDLLLSYRTYEVSALLS